MVEIFASEIQTVWKKEGGDPNIINMEWMNKALLEISYFNINFRLRMPPYILISTRVSRIIYKFCDCWNSWYLYQFQYIIPNNVFNNNHDMRKLRKTYHTTLLFCRVFPREWLRSLQDRPWLNIKLFIYLSWWFNQNLVKSRNNLVLKAFCHK